MKNKYVVIQQSGFQSAILFDETFSHSDFKNVFQDAIVSAGFFDTVIEKDKIKVSTFGKSVALKLESRKEDAKLIEKLLNHSF